MTTGPVTYELHGLAVRSEYVLHGRTAERRPDLEVVDGAPRAVPDDPPRHAAARMRYDDGFSAWVTADQLQVRIGFGRTCEFVTRTGQRSLTVVRDPRADPGTVPRLIESSALARVLGLRGIPTLHASAVEADGRGWVILGGSGNGKSTLAAWLCMDGAAALITDDALRVDLQGAQAHCHSGTTTVRLRDGARDLYERFLAKAAEPEIDGRLLVHPAVAARRVAVDVLLLPAPSRSATRVSLERLPRREALLAVLASPRTLGWEIAGPLRRHFELASFLSARFPAFRVRVPWGPPFKAAHVSSLREQIAAVLEDHRSSDDARRATC